MTEKKEKLTDLQRENEVLKEQVEGLKKRVEELSSKTPKPSKSRTQAEEGLKMLQQGPCTVAQFKTLNDKYPSDVAYYVRTILKVDVKTVRTASGSVYMLGEHYVTYMEGQKKEKEAAKTAAVEAKEEVSQETTEAVATV